jgi:hypothetical protein
MERDHQVSARTMQLDLDLKHIFRLTSARYVLA